MTYNRHTRIIALQVLTLLLLTVPLAGAGYYLYQKHYEWIDLLEQAEPRHARMQGILAEQQNFAQSAELAQKLINHVAYPVSTEGAAVTNEVQETIQTLIAESGLKAQVAQAKEDPPVGSFVPLKISVHIEGSLDQLPLALLKLRDQNPLLIVERMQLQNEGPLTKGSKQRMSGTLDLLVWRAR